MSEQQQQALATVLTLVLVAIQAIMGVGAQLGLPPWAMAVGAVLSAVGATALRYLPAPQVRNPQPEIPPAAER